MDAVPPDPSAWLPLLNGVRHVQTNDPELAELLASDLRRVVTRRDDAWVDPPARILERDMPLAQLSSHSWLCWDRTLDQPTMRITGIDDPWPVRLGPIEALPHGADVHPGEPLVHARARGTG